MRHNVFQLQLLPFLDTSMLRVAPILAEYSQPLSSLNSIFRQQGARKEAFRLIDGIRQETERRDIGYELAVGGYIRLLLLLLVRNQPSAHAEQKTFPTDDSQRIEKVRYRSSNMSITGVSRKRNACC